MENTKNYFKEFFIKIRKELIFNKKSLKIKIKRILTFKSKIK